MNRISRLRCGLRGWSAVSIATMALLSATTLSAQTSTNLVSLTNVLSQAQRPPAPRRPSIILILADNTGYGDLGCYGQTRIKTPNLDKLASEGIRFTDFYVASPEDAPARAALLTGIEPRHAHTGFNQSLASDAMTVAEFLRQFGYHTGLIGVWGLGDVGALTPGKKGFDEFAGFLSEAHARDYYTDRIWRHDPKTGYDDLAPEFPENETKHSVYVPDVLGTAAVNFIRNNKPDEFNRYRAFFLCLAFPIPHDGPVPMDSRYSGEPWPQAQKNRAAMISRMDEAIGRIMGTLEQLKIQTNTAVFFTSVNGPKKEGGMDPKFFDSTGPLRGMQGSVYEGGIRVPMIARWPARIKPGQISNLAWCGSDFLATAAEIGLVAPPEKTDGISVLATLVGREQKRSHETFYWESRQNELQQGARKGEWKGVLIGTNSFELYHLNMDIGEKQNVAEKNPKVVAEMKKLLSPHIAETNAPARP